MKPTILLTAIALLEMMAPAAYADGHHRKPAPPPPPAPAPPPAPEPAPPPDDTPWGKGVALEAKTEAQQLLAKGNEKFLAREFKDALAQYELAIAKWDHPAIRFNIVRVLIALDRPLDAKVNLDKALQYGEGPLEEQIYAEAVNYQRLLAGQIGTLELSCKQPSVQIKVDGQPFVQCPGSSAKEMLPGRHVLVASRPGYLTQTKDVMLMPGKRQSVPVELITIEEGTVYSTRWSKWKPWAVLGGGLAVGGLGLVLSLQARGDIDRLGEQLNELCNPRGCTADQLEASGIRREESRARLQNGIGIGVIATGGAIVVAGVVALIANRPRPYVAEKREPNVTAVVPTATATGGALTVIGRF